MMKNEYRRSLIMLRPHRQGYAGHVRLERRTLMGSMYFAVTIPGEEGALCAAMIRRDREDAYFATKLGMLRSDGRGQATLAHSFDPRNIAGFALEDYQLIVVMLSTGAQCDVALSGNVNGSREIDWSRVRTAACAACNEENQPACELCSQVQTSQRIGKSDDAEQEDVPESTMEQQDVFMIPQVESQEERTSEEESTEMQESPTAAEETEMDMNVPWPGTSESLRTLFAESPKQEWMLNDGFTYIRAPMPENSGYAHVNIGVKTENGVPVAIAYALPDHFAEQPPAGLEGYQWKGGAAEGWWVIYTDAETGRPLNESGNSDTN